MTVKVNDMNKIVKILVVIGFIGLLSACNSSFRSNVSRFHELPAPKGETIVIVPADPRKNTSLEFASYANIVGGYLAQQGYRPAGDGKADLIVELDYGVDDGTVMVRGYSSHFSFGYGYSRFNRYWDYPYGYDYGYYGYMNPFYSHYYSPFYGPYDPFGSHISSYVNYTRKLMMTIRPNKDGAKNLFEGTVESKGRIKNLAKLMPHMVQALFTKFPGESGTTDRIVIELNKDK